jgi:diguanylate cyclase (GGDEF)-like protein
MLTRTRQGLIRLFVVTLALFVAVTVFAYSLVRLSLDSQDRVYIEIAETVMQGIQRERLTDLARQAKDYAFWDSTVQFVLTGDTEWAEDNIGTYLRETFDVDLSMVVGPDNRVTYRSEGETGEGLLSDEQIQDPAVVTLLNGTRSQSAEEPAPVAGVVKRGSALVSVAAALIVPDTGNQQGYGNDHILLLGRVIDDDRLEALGNLLQLKNLTRVDDPKPGYAHYDFIDPLGRHVASLQWDIYRSVDVQHQLLAIFVVFSLVMLLLAVILLRELYQLARNFARSSVNDELTGLHNRRYFNTVGEVEMRRYCREDESVAFLLLDIDYFKRYNDTYGHQQGDEVLRKLGQTLLGIFRRPGDHVIRLGGEEFGIMFSSDSIDEIRGMGEKVRRSVEDMRIAHSGNDLYGVITVSVGGIAGRAQDIGCDIGQAYRLADEQLYAAKGDRRNCVRIAAIGTIPAEASTASA